MVLRVPHAPTRFASIKIVRAAPYMEAHMDSFFTIDATIALEKFDASRGPNGARLSWKTTPGREADVRYRVERAIAVGGSPPAFLPLHAEPLDANEFVDADRGAPAGATAGVRYRLIAVNGLGAEYVLGERAVALDAALPAGRLLSVSPNPAPGGAARILHRVASDLFTTSVAIYDVAGRHVRTLAEGRLAPGVRESVWDGRDDRGAAVPAGVYFVRSSIAPGEVASQRVVVVR
jgi:hypothetical protein